MSRFIKEHWHHVFAFILPVVLMLLIYITFYIYPFGEGSVLVLDLNGQYVSYFEHFRSVFYEGKSLFYSWSSSLGGEFLGTAAYYLLSPFSFIVLLFPQNHITEAILVMSLLKLATATFTMCIYLDKHGVDKEYALLLSLGYGLSAYGVVQIMNIMWIDALILLPLFVLGIEYLSDHKNHLLFIVTLLALFITNYYIAYMIGLFGGLYFVYYNLSSEKSAKEIIRNFGTFIGITICVVMMACFLFLPTIYSLSLGKSTFTTPDYSLFVKFDMLDFFAKLLPSTYDSVNVQGLPFVYCGLFGILGCVYYFISKNISAKHKIYSIMLLVVVFLCMNISWLDLALHGFQNPNWLNYRYAFVVPFIIIKLAGIGFKNLDEIESKHLIGVLGGSILCIAFIQKYGFYYIRDLQSIILSIVVVSIYTFCLILQQKKNSDITLTFILITICIELFTNGYISLHALDDEVLYSTRTSYIPFIQEVRDAYDKILETSDKKLFRVEKNFHRTVNDPMSVGYYGISHSTSSLNRESIQLVNRFGYAAHDHWTKYLGGTPISDSLLGIEYCITRGESVHGYDFYDQSDALMIYKNYNALSILTSVSKNIKNIDMNQASPFILQNLILSEMLNTGYIEFFEPFEVNYIELENVSESQVAGHTHYREIDGNLNAEVFFNFNSSNGKHVYYYFPSSYPRSVNMWFNEEFVDTFFDNESYRIYDLGVVEEGDSLGMTLVNAEVYLKDGVPYFYTFNEGLFTRLIAQLQKSNATILEFDQTKIKATVTSNENEIIYTSIPYEKGWSIYVDGKKTEYYEILDAFIGFDVSEGEHTIEMKFTPHNYVLGSIIGIVGLVLLLIGEYLMNPRFKRMVDTKFKK